MSGCAICNGSGFIASPDGAKGCPRGCWRRVERDKEAMSRDAVEIVRLMLAARETKNTVAHNHKIDEALKAFAAKYPEDKS